MMPAILAMLLLSSLAQSSVIVSPFVYITDLSPSEPMIYDQVQFTAVVQVDVSAVLLVLRWDFGDNETMLTTQNMTVTFVSASHIYTSPGDYYVRVRIVDSLNQTAEDVRLLTVEPRSTALIFQVSPEHININSSLHEYFTLDATLETDQGAPLPDESVTFWYASAASQADLTWYSAASGFTGPGGRLVFTWTPPFEGSYMFKATFQGTSLFAPTETLFSDPCLVADELSVPMLLLPLLLIVPCFIKRK